MGTGKFVSFYLHIPEATKSIKIDQALVIDSPNVPPSQILLGMPEIKQLHMVIDCSEDQIIFKKDHFKLPLVSQKSVYAVHSMIPVVQNSCDPELSDKQIEKLVQKHRVSKADIKKSPRDYESELDARKAYKQEMARAHKKRAQENTANDVIFDEDFCKANPGLKEEILAILNEYPDVFKNVVGQVPKVYEINPTFLDDNKTPARMKQRDRSEAENNAIKKKLDLEFQDGILKFPEDYGIQVVNQIPLLPVQKRDDDGELIPKDVGMRVVADCKVKINRMTKDFAALEVDNISQVLHAAARASRYKWKFKFDIASAFFQVGLAKSAWKNMGVHHPEMGQMIYTRLPQGWLPSFGWCSQVFRKIFGRCTHFLYRYMDDAFCYGESKEVMLVRLRKVLDVCRLNGITLKGSKMRFFEFDMNFLGHKISEGEIHPSPHRMLRAQEFSMENITTAADLRKFLGVAHFLAKHLRRSATVFQHLRKFAGKDGKTKIPWSENNNFYEKEFKRAKAALKELCALTPYDATRESYVLVDSSATGVGAILYQKQDNGSNKVVEFYSRKRPDAERKNKVGSCILELAGMCGALHYWRKYLEGSNWPVTVFSDSKSLEALANRYVKNEIPSENKTINSFFAGLSGLRVRVIYLPGKSIDISGVDHISRDNLPDCDTPNCDVCKTAATPTEQETIFVQRVGDLCECLEKKFSEELDDEYLYQNSPVSDENLASNIIHMKIGNPFKRVNMIFPIRAVYTSNPDHKNIRLEDLQSRTWMIRDAQNTEPHLKGAKRCLLTGELYGPKEFRIKTLIDTKKAYLSGNIIKYKKFIGQDQFEITPIPASFAIIAMTAIHNSYGCMSPAQMLQHFRRHFDCPNAKNFIYQFTQACKQCVLLRKDNQRCKPDVKIIKPPDKLGELLFVDELSRRDRKNQELKILFATEGLSRFGMVQKYEGTLTGEQFVSFMALARTILSPLHRPNSNIIVRTDAASSHTSSQVIKDLKKLGMAVEIYESGTRSKNIIPEHDSRCAILSKFLNLAMQEPRFTTQQALNWAIIQYNTSLTNLNWAPAEIFANRTIGPQDSLNISTAELKKRILDNREKAKVQVQRRNERKKLKKKLELIPYSNPNLNDPEVNRALWKTGKVTLKPNDIVKLNVEFDKNDYNRLFRIKSINWENETFEAQKVNLPRGKIFKFKFEVIDEVIGDFIRFLTNETLARDKLLLLAWGSGILNNKLELDYSVSSEPENNLQNLNKVPLDDSGKPTSPEEWQLQSNLENQECTIQPVQLEMKIDPRFVPATPYSPEDETESTFQSCQETLTSDQNESKSSTGSSELNETYLNQEISKMSDPNTSIQPGNPKFQSSPKAVESRPVRKSVRKAAKTGQQGAFKKWV